LHKWSISRIACKPNPSRTRHTHNQAQDRIERDRTTIRVRVRVEVGVRVRVRVRVGVRVRVRVEPLMNLTALTLMSILSDKRCLTEPRHRNTHGFCVGGNYSLVLYYWL